MSIWSRIENYTNTMWSSPQQILIGFWISSMWKKHEIGPGPASAQSLDCLVARSFSRTAPPITWSLIRSFTRSVGRSTARSLCRSLEPSIPRSLDRSIAHWGIQRTNTALPLHTNLTRTKNYSWPCGWQLSRWLPVEHSLSKTSRIKINLFMRPRKRLEVLELDLL